MEFSEIGKYGVEKQFDGYCRKILLRKACNCFSDLLNKTKHEKSLGDLSAAEMGQLVTNDTYPSFYTLFHVSGFETDILVANGELANAFLALDPARRDVVLMYYFFDLGDREIAKLMHLVRSAVEYRRLRALKAIKAILEQGKGIDE